MKLIICDIDGTLIDSPRQKLPSPRLIDAIHACKNDFLVACATGRSRTWARSFLLTAGFTAPCILGGGTYIVDPINQEIIWEMPLPKAALDKIKQVLRPYPAVRVLFNDYSEEDYISGGWALEKLMAEDEVFIMELVGISRDLADDLMGHINAIEDVTTVKMLSLAPGGLVDVHILNRKSTKEHAISELGRITGIGREDAIGIGDGHNDFHIFSAVGTKVAMGNAVPELKKQADIVIGNVQDDAVAEFLENLRA